MVGWSRWTLVLASVVAVGCGPSADAPVCADATMLEVTSVDGLADELVDAAVDHAHDRFDRFFAPLHGHAFVGGFQTASAGVVHSSDDALALLSVDGPWVHFALADRDGTAQMMLDYWSPRTPEWITSGHPDVHCPSDLPVPVAGEPFALPPTVCQGAGARDDVELSVEMRPMDEDAFDWDDLLFLNDLAIHGQTPANYRFEPSGHGFATVDQASYLSADGALRLYVDYEAHWFIDVDCPTNQAIVRIDILHAETCDISGHTHGRYDSDCTTIATVDGRPGWASGF